MYGLPVDAAEGTRIIKIRLLAASGLLKKDIFGLSDPYCRVSLCQDRSNPNEDTVTGTVAVSEHIKKTLNPVWDAQFRFRVNPSSDYLLFEVFDYNKLTSDDFLGLVRFPLYHIPVNHQEISQSDAPTHDLSLQQRSRRSRVKGQLKVQFMYEPSTEAEVEAADTQTENNPPDEEWESLEGPLPEGWEHRTDFSGRLVYVDHINRVVTLDRPTRPTVRARPSIVRQHSSFDRRQISEDSEMNVPPPDISLATRFEGSGEDNESGQGAAREAQGEDSLPDGWEARTDFSGRVVYIDHNNQTTTFERPSSTIVPSVPEEDGDFGFEQLELGPPTPPETLEIEEGSVTETDSAVPESPLPSGWTRGVDKGSGRTFYIDHNSRTTSWVRPEVRTDQMAAQLGPLPAGWEMRHTTTGRPYFINHESKETSWDDPRLQQPLPGGWEMRVHADGRVFYVDHATRSTQWEDPRKTTASTGPAVAYSRDYKVKYDNFKANLPKPTNSSGSKCEILVKRASVFEDSFNSIMSKNNVDTYRRRLWITFEGEPGLDYGGVAREWFYLLSREMFNPYYGLFEYSAIDNYTLQINPQSGLLNPDHERYFQFIGIVCAMAVYHGKLIEAFFIRPFYKMMLGKNTIVLEDMAEVDVETYNSLKWVLDNDPECLCLTFSAQEDRYGEMVEVPLVANGSDIDVTNENKQGYVTTYIRYKFVDRIQKQMAAFVKGFTSVIPLRNLQVFDANELEYLMCGITQIDVKDWEEYTTFKGGYHSTHHVVVWFWKAIQSFDNEFRARLLQFVTGTSRVPMNGFRELQGSNGPQQFCIEMWGGMTDLPRAHTCFNRIDLPPYESYHVLREKVKLAVECTGGFDID